MSGWADRKIRDAAEKEKDERDKNEKQARHHALKLADAPILWDHLIQTLKSEMDLYNDSFAGKLGINGVTIGEPDRAVQVLTSPGRELMLSFDRKVPKIYYELKKSEGPQGSKKTAIHGSFGFDVIKEKEVWLVHANTKGIFDGPYDVGAAAGLILDTLVD